VPAGCHKAPLDPRTGPGANEATAIGWLDIASGAFAQPQDSLISDALASSAATGVFLYSVACSISSCYVVNSYRPQYLYLYPIINSVTAFYSTDFVDYGRTGALTALSCVPAHTCYAHGASNLLNQGGPGTQNSLDYWLTPSGWSFYISQAVQNSPMVWDECGRSFCLEKNSVGQPGYEVTTTDGRLVSYIQPEDAHYAYSGACNALFCTVVEPGTNGKSQILTTNLQGVALTSMPIEGLFATGTYCSAKYCFVPSSDSRIYEVALGQPAPFAYDSGGTPKCAIEELVLCLVHQGQTNYQLLRFDTVPAVPADTTPVSPTPSSTRVYMVGDSVTYLTGQVSSDIYPTADLGVNGTSISSNLGGLVTNWMSNQTAIFANEPASDEVYADYGFWDLFFGFAHDSQSVQAVVAKYMQYLQQFAAPVASYNHQPPQPIQVTVSDVLYTPLVPTTMTDMFNAAIIGAVRSLQALGCDFQYCPLNSYLWPAGSHVDYDSARSVVIMDDHLHPNTRGAPYILKAVHDHCAF
jgi:hypothetical protein